MSKHRPLALASAAMIAGMLALAGVAWACSPSAYLSTDVGEGPAGGRARVAGNQYYATGSSVGTAGATAGPVEVRWNDLNGALLGSAAGPNFSIQVTIPQASTPGPYVIVGVQRDSAGQVVGKMATSYQVTSSSPSPGSGSGTAPSNSGTNTSGSAAGVEEAEDASESQATTNAQSHKAGASATTSARSGETSAGAGSSNTSGAAPADQSRTRAPSSAANRATAAAAGGTVAENATTGTETAAGVAAEAAEAPMAAVAASPTAASAAGDLWGGFRSATTASLLPTENPSPASTRPFAAGVALLCAGLVSMFAGIAVTVARRRRVLAG